jgi:hypothetical protein
MNSSIIILQILQKYNHKPYFKLDDYISINDDRFGVIKSFKIYENEKNIVVDFREISKNFNSNIIRTRRNHINSIDEFKEKWYNFYYGININEDIYK